MEWTPSFKTASECQNRRGSQSAVFGSHRPAESFRFLKPSLLAIRCEWRSLTSVGSGSLRLQRAEPEQREPVRMLLTCHQSIGTSVFTFSPSAAHEAPMVKEESQQVQVRRAQVATQCEVRAQPRVEVLNQRTAARRMLHGARHSDEHGIESGAQLGLQAVPALPVRGRGDRLAVQHARGAHEIPGHLCGPRDGGELFIKYAGEREQVIALILQRHTHRADATGTLMLGSAQLLDDEVEQRLPRGEHRARQRKNVVVEPLGERAQVARQLMRAGFRLTRQLQLAGEAVGPINLPFELLAP
jgi:hypothetical protein